MIVIIVSLFAFTHLNKTLTVEFSIGFVEGDMILIIFPVSFFPPILIDGRLSAVYDQDL